MIHGPTEARRVRVGVIGVGSMGRHHARVYSELPSVELVGVSDFDDARAATVADEHHTRAMDEGALVAAVDAVSVAVPTADHFAVARSCLAAGVHVLVEKPFVVDPADGRTLATLAGDRSLILQVGHVERFNPAVRTAQTIVSDHDIVAIDAQRLGPPTGRTIADSAVVDLMIHDIDIMLALVDSPVTAISAVGTHDNRYASAQFRFENDVVATLIASRVTQQKIRRLNVTARECRINVDYTGQSVNIHRHSHPEYVETNGDVNYRHESVVERPTIQNGEPLKNELSSFVSAVRSGTEPVVPAADGLRALELTRRVDDIAARKRASEGVHIA